MSFSKKVKTFFKKFGVGIKNTPNKKSVALWSTLLFVSLSLTFVAGMFSKKTEFEVAGHEISEMVQNNTKDGEYSYMLVESVNEEKPLPRPYREYLYWYNVFGDSRNAFLGVVNGNKEHEANFADFNQDQLLTFVYADVFSNVEYNGHWKHEYYHIELMFKGDHSYNYSGGDTSFCYITENQARVILKNENPTLEEYESLIGTKLKIMMDGVSTSWHIGNIILENNDVTDAITKLFGNWVLSYIHFPTGFNKQFCYIYNKYDFQNMYKLEYLHTNFNNPNDYSITYGINNLIKPIHNENITTIIQNTTTSNLAAEIIVLILAYVLFICCIYTFYKNNLLLYKYNVLWLFISLIFPYLLFFSFGKIFNNIILFSYSSLVYYFIPFCITLCFILFSIFIKRRKKE